MKKIFVLLIIGLILSCGKEKIIQLPEIKHSNISEINDVSAAYLFYDETMPDSIELNRKNLISTTNWLVNVDKRLTLKQALPKIMFLQDKKRNAELHKNENAKNYFTCNDTSIKNLGFIEFTDVVYHDEPAGEFFSETLNISTSSRFSITFYDVENIEITGYIDSLIIKKTNKTYILNTLSELFSQQNRPIEIILNFNQKLKFQDYISFKSILSKLDLKNVTVSNHEFIFN
jgi:hypothetical protein